MIVNKMPRQGAGWGRFGDCWNFGKGSLGGEQHKEKGGKVIGVRCSKEKEVEAGGWRMKNGEMVGLENRESVGASKMLAAAKLNRRKRFELATSCLNPEWDFFCFR